MCSCGIDTPCYGGCPCGCTHTGPVDAKPTDVLSDYEQGQRDARRSSWPEFVAAVERDALAAYPGHTQLITDARAQGARDALARCIDVIQSFDWDVNTGMDFTGSDIIAAIKGDG